MVVLLGLLAALGHLGSRSSVQLKNNYVWMVVLTLWKIKRPQIGTDVTPTLTDAVKHTGFTLTQINRHREVSVDLYFSVQPHNGEVM